MPADSKVIRCGWAKATPRYLAYHDEEWGVPLHDDRRLFEMLVLEGHQAGLSWETILNKRDHYRVVFDRFDPKKVAAYRAPKIRSLLADPGIVRNRLKVAAAVTNAKAFLEVQSEHGSFDRFLWGFVDGTPVQNARRTLKDVPPRTELSDAISKELKRRGFTFVGTTICYAFIQAVGIVNDHVIDCFRHRPLGGPGVRPRRTPARAPR